MCDLYLQVQKERSGKGLSRCQPAAQEVTCKEKFRIKPDMLCQVLYAMLGSEEHHRLPDRQKRVRIAHKSAEGGRVAPYEPEFFSR